MKTFMLIGTAASVIGCITLFGTITSAVDNNKTVNKVDSKKEWKKNHSYSSVRGGGKKQKQRTLQYHPNYSWGGEPQQPWNGGGGGGGGGYHNEEQKAYRKGSGKAGKAGKAGKISGAGGNGGGGGDSSWHPWEPSQPNHSDIVQVVSSNNGLCLSTTNGAPAFAATTCTQGGSVDQNFELIEPFYMPGMAPVVGSFRLRQVASTSQWSQNSWGGPSPGTCLLAPSGCATGVAIQFGSCDNSLANFVSSDQGSTLVAIGCGVFPQAAISSAAADGALTIVNPAVADVAESFYFQMVIKNHWGGWRQ